MHAGGLAAPACMVGQRVSAAHGRSQKSFSLKDHVRDKNSIRKIVLVGGSNED
jgi:hypothetical protein